MRTHVLMIMLCSVYGSCLQSAVVLKGDADAASNETFSFAIGHHEQSGAAQNFAQYSYVAADSSAAGSSKGFAIARVERGKDQFTAMAPEEINLNPTKELVETDELDGEGNKKKKAVSKSNVTQNPFYNSGLAHFAWLNGDNSPLGGSKEKLVLVNQNDLTTLYLLDTFNQTFPKNSLLVTAFNISLASSVKNNVPSATAAVTSGIMGVATGDLSIFAAVKPSAGGSAFGDTGSGIAVAQLGFFGDKDQNAGLTIVDAPTFSALRTAGNRAVALDVTSDFLKINSDLASFGQVVDMVWFEEMSRLYIALNVTGGAGGTDGTRALAVARVRKGVRDGSVVPLEFIIEPFAPTGVFDGALDKIVGGVGANTSVSIHNVQRLYTSTSLPYLVGVGGVGSSATTKRSVFAVPLVIGNTSEAVNGSIANKNTTPKSFYGPARGTATQFFLTRGITEPATTAAEMPLATDAAVRVGAGDLVNGDIVDLYVYQDAVFVTVQEADGNQRPGIFYSQPFFDDEGKIKGWSSWKRSAGTIGAVRGMEFDPTTPHTLFLQADSGGDVRTIQRTEWSTGEGLEPAVSAVNGQLSSNNGGVQGLFDFVVTSTTLDTQTPGLQNVSLLVATGLKKVLLIETSRVESGIVIPNRTTDFGSIEFFDDGTITKTFPTGNKIIAIEGGALDAIGAMNAAEIARDGSSGANGWLFVGGIGGVAVLSSENGAGWDATSKLDPGFDGLVSGMAFKSFGDYSFVRKIINDGQFLYILTSSTLDRIDLTQGTPGLGTITATTIATVRDLIGADGTFLDMVISEKVALLATSAGLLRIADGNDVQTASNPAWQQVATPEAIGPIRQLVSFSVTGRSQDVSKKTVGGMVYALSAYRGKNQSQVFRFAVQDTQSSDVSSSTIVRLPDEFIQNLPSYFVSFGVMRNALATDGSIFVGTRGQHLEDDPLVTTLISNNTVGISNRFSSRPLFARAFDVGLSDSMLISSILKLSSSGSWLVGTDAGMRVNE